MTIPDFLTFFNGIYADYDGAFGDQCFDLANLYSRWIGGPRFSGATADLIYRQAGDFYIQVPNNPDNFPLKGDIVVWDWPHVGVATGENTDTNQFEVLEQNDPTDSNCHLKVYSYSSHLLGWLHPKVDLSSANQAQILTQPTVAAPINEIYLGILGTEASSDEIASRQSQLDSGTALHDIVSQVLNEDSRSPLLKANTEIAGQLAQNGDLSRQLNECLNKPAVTVPTPPNPSPTPQVPLLLPLTGWQRFEAFLSGIFKTNG